MSGPIRVAIIDDHPLFREGVSHSLSEIGGFEIVGKGGSRDEALQIARSQHPHIVLIDISMPGGGLAAIGPILEGNPEQKIVVLTVSESSSDVMTAFDAGAKGYVLKGIGSSALAEALRIVASGESYISPTLSARLLAELHARRDNERNGQSLASLSDRELEILRFVAKGATNKQIALQLDLQEKTVKHHMTKIMSKLGVSNRTEAAIAFRNLAA